MFTGIVETQGTVIALDQIGTGCTLNVQTDWPDDELKIGASVAVNGCCLTITELSSGKLSFEAGSETLSCTNLGELSAGSKVNLERAMQATDRFDGHIVTGHVDCQGKVITRNDDDKWSEFWIEVPPEFTRQMAPKGSVTVDGVSLTLVQVQEDRFSLALIPHTLDVTIIGSYQVGRTVNIETDVLAKYIQKQLQHLNQTT